MEWQPIDSAPKDRLIMLWWPAYSYSGSECEEPSPVLAMGRWKDNPRIGRGYFADTDELDDYGLADCRPTHWMPLPEPPHE